MAAFAVLSAHVNKGGNLPQISHGLMITQAFADISEKARFALLVSKFRFWRKAHLAQVTKDITAESHSLSG